MTGEQLVMYVDLLSKVGSVLILFCGIIWHSAKLVGKLETIRAELLAHNQLDSQRFAASETRLARIEEELIHMRRNEK